MNLNIELKKPCALWIMLAAVVAGGCAGDPTADNAQADNGQSNHVQGEDVLGDNGPACVGTPSLTCDTADSVTCRSAAGCQAMSHDVCSDVGAAFGGAGCSLYALKELCSGGCSWQNDRCVQSVNCSSLDISVCKQYSQCTIMQRNDGCDGQITPCEQLSRTQCTNTPGCRLATPECQGTTTDTCGAHSGSTVAACSRIKGCHAILNAGDITCDGTVRSCDRLTATDCTITRGCTLTAAGREYSSGDSTSGGSNAGTGNTSGTSSSGNTASKEQARLACMEKCWNSYTSCSDACTYYGDSWSDPDTHSECMSNCNSKRSSCENRC
jgi:hypothetical protein